MATRPPRLTPQEQEARLSQEESTAISDLLKLGLPADDEPVRGPKGSRGADPIVLRFDLVAGSSRGGDELPGLQLVHERFASELANEFRRAVGSEGNIIPERVGYYKFADIYARLTVPTVILIANLEGVGCSVVISMEPELAMHFIDLLMGGEGGLMALHGDLVARGLTLAEKGVLRHVMAIMSRALATACQEFAVVKLELTRVATDPRHAAIFEPSEPMAELVVRVEWGAVVGAIHLSLPTSFLAQYDAALSRTAPPNAPIRAEAGSVDLMRAHLGPVVVNLAAILGSAEMTLERLLSLAPGDVVRLDADPDQPLTIQIEGEPKMRGFPTMQHGNVAVRIEEFIGEASSTQGEDDGESTEP